MQITPLDLDGAGSPFALVAKIFEHEPGLKIPVDIEALAYQLGITEIGDLKTSNFEGGLIANDTKTEGMILVREGVNKFRRRFTIGHELGHFLIPSHKPIKGQGFECTRADMKKQKAQKHDIAARMEVEANEFSALILSPPHLLRKDLAKSGTPDLLEMLAIHRRYQISKESAARRYTDYHGENIAIVISKNGKILYTNKKIGFPKLCIQKNDPLPKHIRENWAKVKYAEPSDLRQIGAEHWLETEWGKKISPLYEQTLILANGVKFVLLWSEKAEEEFDPDENRTSKQRLEARLKRWE